MIKKIIQSSIVIFSLLINFNTDVQAFSWYEQISLKITMKTEETLYEWEFENPNSFEFEKGDKIIRDVEAKESFESILHFIDLSEPTINDETIKILEQNGYPNINKIVINRLDYKQRNQTWIWKNE
ncbi:hypothetical protein QA612_05780 [Evansella sp. AB-P1]|uniref:hypothetical protein n=1 Tax=Evansella sp. AB-P1 TaxID=3037653 RepID=UPI00241F79BD|nr:hypothetical protein [Evansella sp. AB-P1]MDG5786995.1 hypothetical protein [Evansella sp. AB-P1]